MISAALPGAARHRHVLPDRPARGDLHAAVAGAPDRQRDRGPAHRPARVQGGARRARRSSSPSRSQYLEAAARRGGPRPLPRAARAPASSAASSAASPTGCGSGRPTTPTSCACASGTAELPSRTTVKVASGGARDLRRERGGDPRPLPPPRRRAAARRPARRRAASASPDRCRRPAPSPARWSCRRRRCTARPTSPSSPSSARPAWPTGRSSSGCPTPARSADRSWRRRRTTRSALVNGLLQGRAGRAAGVDAAGRARRHRRDVPGRAAPPDAADRGRAGGRASCSCG